MNLQEILSWSGGGMLLLLSLIQVSPVKVNPWSAILGWFGKQINKDMIEQIDSVKKDIRTLQTDIDTIRDESRAKNATDSRARILQFSDEIYLEQRHSQERFKHILRDITDYERYCSGHPEFENSIAVAAIDQIKEAYNMRLRKHDFLK